MAIIDLHIHTNLSDGAYAISEIVSFSKQNNCNTIAITDHEFIQDYSSFEKKYHINIINGIEFNTSIKGLHILGYGICNINNIQTYMDWLHRENEEVAYLLIDKLKSKGIDISLEKLKLYLKLHNFKYKYLDKRHIVKYLINQGITKDVWDTYQRLIGRGTELYIPLKKITPTQVIDKICQCGGVSVLAHPFTLNYTDEQLYDLIYNLKNIGLDGIEVINGNTPVELQQKYEKIAEKFSLIKTVGSDFHDLNSCKIGIEYNDEIIDALNEKIKIKHRLK